MEISQVQLGFIGYKKALNTKTDNRHSLSEALYQLESNFDKSSSIERSLELLGNYNLSANPVFCGNISNIGNEFAIKFPKTFFKKLLREGVPDAYSPIKELIPREDFDNHRAFGTFGKKGQLAIKYLKEYKDSFFPIEKEVFTILENLSKRHPNLNLQELLKLRYVNAEQTLINQQSEILNKINLMIRKLPKSEFLEMRKLINSSFDRIFAPDPLPEERFGRKNFLKALKAFPMSDEQLKQRIIAVAEQLPQSSNSVNAFIVKYSQPYRFRYNENTGELFKLPRDSQEIGERLLEPSLGTDDHIHPQKEFRKEMEAYLKGDKKARNLSRAKVTVLVSKKANETKTDIPLDRFIEQSPYDIPDLIQKQFDRLVHICEVWLKKGNVEDANLLADYIIELAAEYGRRSKTLNIDLTSFENILPSVRKSTELHQIRVGAKKHKKHSGKISSKRPDAASNSHSESYEISYGKYAQNRKVQKHSSRFKN